MIWAIGAVDQVCRLMLETTDEEAAARQCGPDEVAVTMETMQRGVIRRTAGGYVVEPCVIDPPWRIDRNLRLTASDWTQLPDAPLGPELQAAWALYRQALRDYDGTGALPASPDEQTS